MDKKLAIVIPVFNNWFYTKNIISQLTLLPKNHKVIIIDNASTDETKNLQDVMRNEINLGFGKACNMGYSKAKGLGYENVMFLNNDVKVLTNFNNWTEELLSNCEDDVLVGPTAGVLDNNLNFVCETSKWPNNGHGYLSAWCICGSINTWDKLIINNDIGPFSTEFFAYFEDTDLSFRAKQKNIELRLIPITVKHYGRMTGKKLNLGSIFTQSRAIFLSKWRNQ